MGDNTEVSLLNGQDQITLVQNAGLSRILENAEVISRACSFISVLFKGLGKLGQCDTEPSM